MALTWPICCGRVVLSDFCLRVLLLGMPRLGVLAFRRVVLSEFCRRVRASRLPFWLRAFGELCSRGCCVMYIPCWKPVIVGCSVGGADSGGNLPVSFGINVGALGLGFVWWVGLGAKPFALMEDLFGLALDWRAPFLSRSRKSWLGGVLVGVEEGNMGFMNMGLVVGMKLDEGYVDVD